MSGAPPPPKKKNNNILGFLSNTGLGPLKNHIIQNSMLSRHRPAAGGQRIAPLVMVFESSLPSKNVAKIGHPLPKLSGSVPITCVEIYTYK